MNVKLVSSDRKVSKLCEVEPGTFPEYGTWDDLNTVEEWDEEWNVEDKGPYRWVEFIPRGSGWVGTNRTYIIYTSGDIWLQDDHGGTLERVR